MALCAAPSAQVVKQGEENKAMVRRSQTGEYDWLAKEG